MSRTWARSPSKVRRRSSCCSVRPATTSRKLQDGRAHYNGLLYPTGGFVDDIVIYRNAADDYFIVVNASNTDKDFEWFAQSANGLDVEVKNVSADYAQLALQGPDAQSAAAADDRRAISPT